MKKIMEETISATIKQLKKHKLLKPNRDTTFEKTEKLLYSYQKIKSVIKTKYEEIEDIKSFGLPGKSKSITSIGSGNITAKSEVEKVEEKIMWLQSSINHLNDRINFIDAALGKIKDDPYYDLIQLKYFEEKSREDIAEFFEVDVSTITRNKNRLINTLKIYLFPDYSIIEYFE